MSDSRDNLNRMRQAVEKWEKDAEREKVSRVSQKIKSSLESADQLGAAKSNENFEEREPSTVRKALNQPETASKTDKPAIDHTVYPARGYQKKAYSTPTMSAEGTEQRTRKFSTDFMTREFSKFGAEAGTKFGEDRRHIEERNNELEEVQIEQEETLKSLAVRFAASIFIALLLSGGAVFAAAASNVVASDMVAFGYILFDLIMLLIAGIAAFPGSVKGIVRLFAFKPDSDSIVSLSFYAALIGNLYTLCCFIFYTQPPAGVSASAVYSSCASVSLSFSLLGKILHVARVKNNLELLKKIDTVYAAYTVSEEAASGILPTFDGTASIVNIAKTGALTGFVEKSYEPSPPDKTVRIYAPIALAAALVTTIIYAASRDAGGAIATFCAICCVACPPVFELGASLPFFKAGRRLVKHGSMITGYDDINVFGSADVIVADGSFVFPGKFTKIVGVKTFHNVKIEDAVLYASSIADAGKSPLASAFLDIFSDVGIGKKLLKKVDRIAFEDNKGLYAVIDNKVVLLGNRHLMHRHMIDTPSRDYEMRYAMNGRDVVYLAVDGRVCAIFIVMYGIDEETGGKMRRLDRYGIGVLINTSDPNITPQLIEEKCGLNSEDVSVLDARQINILEKNRFEGSAKAGLAFKNMAGYAETIISCVKLKGSVWANTILQIVLACIGILFVSLLEYLGNTVSAAFVLTYQLICAVPVILIGILRRN